MSAEAIVISKDGRSEILLAVPTNTIDLPNEGIRPSSYSHTQGEVHTNWTTGFNINHHNEVARGERREDFHPPTGRGRIINVGHFEPQEEYEFTSYGEAKALTLNLLESEDKERRLVKGFTVHLESSPDINQEYFSCLFTYGATGKFISAQVAVSSANKAIDKDLREREDPADYFEERPLQVNLTEAVQIFEAESHGMYGPIEDDEEDIDEDLGEDTLQRAMLDIGFLPEQVDRATQQLRGIIAGEVNQYVSEDILSTSNRGYFVDQLSIEVLAELKSLFENTNGTIRPILRREFILPHLNAALAGQLMDEVDQLAEAGTVGIDVEFPDGLDVQNVKYQISDEEKTAEVINWGQPFTYDSYQVRSGAFGESIVIDVVNIQDKKKTKRFVSPKSVNIREFYHRVSDPFSDGLSALETVDGLYIQVEDKI